MRNPVPFQASLKHVVLALVLLVLLVLLVASCGGEAYIPSTPNATMEAHLAPQPASGVQIKSMGKVFGNEVVRMVDEYAACYFTISDEPVCVPHGGR